MRGLRRGVMVAASLGALASAALATVDARAATRDIEYVAEHLPEVAMDNRYATLPVWNSANGTLAAPRRSLALGVSRSATGGLRLSGPSLSASWSWPVGERWTATALGFYDRLDFSGSGDERPLRTLAIAPLPLPLPAPARFDAGDGRLEHHGLGVAFATEREGGRLGRHRWLVGLQFESARLVDYGFRWQILAGPAAGTLGHIGFDAAYTHATPFAGLELPRAHGRWTIAPHVLLAVPLPRRGVETQLSGPGFSLAGDTASAGHGKHFGDPSLALGVDLTFEPLGLSIDLGSTLTQATLERIEHRGMDSNLSLAVTWRF